MITLAQPLVYLLLFSAVFRKVADIPGFTTGSYVDFFTPGIVVVTALFSGGWAGMGVINDLNAGILDRLLVSPVSRGALIAGGLMHRPIIAVIQSLIVVGLGIAIGASFPGGVIGVVVLIAAAVLLGAAFGALSIGLALLLRKEESVVGAVQMLLLPLTFLSIRVDAARSHARLDPGRLTLQPARVGGAGRARGGQREPRLGPRPLSRRLPARLRARVRLARNARLPRLPALRLSS